MRQTPEAIIDKRNKKDASVLVTGATGFLGSHLAVELLKQGHSVTLLNRPQGELSSEQRTSQILDWFGHSPAQFPNLRVLEGSIAQKYLGLGQHLYASLGEETDEIFHCAANTSFAERKREEIEKANLYSLKNVLDLAAEGNCYFFHYISTAFSVGINSEGCEEDFVETTKFNNVYEETKHKAEKMVLQECRDQNIRLNIYRPSIVYGHSRTGKSIRFNALYYPVKLIHSFRKLYAKDIEENGGEAASQIGVYREQNGRIHLPVRIRADSHGGLNLIPIDYFVEACLAIMRESLEGDIFHIVNDTASTLEKLIRYVQEYFSISGIKPTHESEYSNHAKNPLEKLMEDYLAIYMPYMLDMRVFKQDKAQAILKKHNISCPEFNYEIFRRIMDYAVKVDWGKRLFS